MPDQRCASITAHPAQHRGAVLPLLLHNRIPPRIGRPTWFSGRTRLAVFVKSFCEASSVNFRPCTPLEAGRELDGFEARRRAMMASPQQGKKVTIPPGKPQQRPAWNARRRSDHITEKHKATRERKKRGECIEARAGRASDVGNMCRRNQTLLIAPYGRGAAPFPPPTPSLREGKQNLNSKGNHNYINIKRENQYLLSRGDWPRRYGVGPVPLELPSELARYTGDASSSR